MLVPGDLPLPDEPLVGAAAVHALLRGWRELLQTASAPSSAGGVVRTG